MDNNNKKVYFEALKYLLFLSASLHMIILFIYLPISKDIGSINYFKLTGIGFIFPALMTYKYIDLASIVLMIGLYFIILKILKNKK